MGAYPGSLSAEDAIEAELKARRSAAIQTPDDCHLYKAEPGMTSATLPPPLREIGFVTSGERTNTNHHHLNVMLQSGGES